MEKNLALIDKLYMHLFEGKSIAESYFDDDELEVKKRVEAGFMQMLDNPTFNEKQIRTFLVNTFNISERTAFRDLILIRTIYGSVKDKNKEYYRHRVNAILERAIELAETNKDAYALIAAAKEMKSANRVDQNDIDEVPWHQIIPPSFEPTNDIEVLGFKRNPDIQKRIAKYRRKFGIEDATVIEE